jgi:2-phosphosulfolactate phosphatase
MRSLDVLLTPLEFSALPQRDLSKTVCVVFDVLRATSTMVNALANGAAAIAPMLDIKEALEFRRTHPDALLAGERSGTRIGPALTGGITFDLGNSPREFTKEAVGGRLIATTTSNGTRALRACAGAHRLLLGSFLNLQATANYLKTLKPELILLVCAGTGEETSLEDALGAGALCDLLWTEFNDRELAEAARITRHLYLAARSELPTLLKTSLNGRGLLNHPQLCDDVPFCAQRDIHDFVATLDKDGLIRKQTA